MIRKLQKKLIRTIMTVVLRFAKPHVASSLIHVCEQ